jgi:TolB-like protein/DNA-binding SARP family transcriptional activator/Flp pilus assembly protein TadD
LFSLKLFGGASIETLTGPLTGRAVQRHRLALLALLAAASTRGLSRDKLIAYLWPEADSDKGRRLLSDSVYRINQAIGKDVIYGVGGELRLDLQHLPSDVAEFEAEVGRGDWERAVDLYAGAFLDGFFLADAPEFERWVEAERDRLGREYARALEALAIAAETEGNRARAVHWWRMLAVRDPFNSRIALHLMQALDAAGERAAALQHARTHALLLREEFGTEPDHEIVALAERLRAQPVVSGAAPAPPPHAGSSSPPAAASPAPVIPHAEVIPEADGGAGAAGGRAAGSDVRRTRLAVVLGVAAGLLVLLGFGLFWQGRQAPVAPAPAPSPPTIAVLPFTDLSPGGDHEYFSDGITEELISTLTGVEGLRVASSRSVFAYRNSNEDVRAIGAKLGVATVLEGSVRWSGDRLRITSKLVSVDDGYQLWAETYDRPAGDAFVIQQEIAQAIVQTLRGRLVGASAASSRPRPDPEAYELYLRGRSALQKAGLDRTSSTGEGYLKAIKFYEQAIARDSTFAPVYVAVATSLTSLAFYDYLSPDEAFPRAEAAARKAVELDPALGTPHNVLGYVQLYYRWNLARAEEEFRRAIELAPTDPLAHQWYANMLTIDGRFPEAVREIRRSLEADPLRVIAVAVEGWIQYYAREYPAALEALGRALERNPDHGATHLWRAWTLEEMDSLPAALDAHRRAVAASDSGAVFVAALGRALALAGDRPGAEALLRRLEARGASGGYVPAYEIAKLHEALGRRDRALEWLDRAYRERSHSMAFLKIDPQLDGLRSDPRFVDLVERVGLQ